MHDMQRTDDAKRSDEPATGAFEDAWNTYRPRLLAQANRMVRDPAIAEDIVQDAFRRFDGVPAAEIQDIGGWLSVVVRRLCLNRLRSAYARHEGVSANDAAIAAPQADPADRVTLDDEVQLALAVVLDRLTPPERTAFVLHDVFGFPYDAIATIVGRTPGACRQLASRARRSIRANATDPADSPVYVEPAQHRAVVERFIAACTGGDIAELMAVLDPDVDGHAELIGGGVLSDLSGRDAVAQRLLGLCGPGSGTLMIPVDIEGEAAVISYTYGRFTGIVQFEHEDGRIKHMRSFVMLPSRS
jgi:RNA polymerase sigma-70 factor (ECF subfamily)